MKYNVSNDLKIILSYLNISQEDFSFESDIRKETISRIINNEIYPSDETLEKIYGFAYKKNIRLNESKIDYLKKKHNIVLFHGSKSQIDGDLSLSYSKKYVDFGQGFYAGENYEQSLDFISFVPDGSIYVLDVDYNGLDILELDVSLDWMLFIALNRGKLEEYKDNQKYIELVSKLKKYDVVIAPIADNRMFTTIDDFTKSAISSDQAIHALKKLSLGNQIVFKSEKALRKIKILERLYVSKLEKEESKKQKIEIIKSADSFISEAYKKYARSGLYINEVFNNEKTH